MKKVIAVQDRVADSVADKEEGWVEELARAEVLEVEGPLAIVSARPAEKKSPISEVSPAWK